MQKYKPAYPYHNAQEEYQAAMRNRDDTWVVAHAGTETEFQVGTYTYIYVYNPRRHKHGWLNLTTDIVEMTQPRMASS